MKKFSSVFATTAIYLMTGTMGYSQTYTTIQISNDDFHYNNVPQINANGQVVWEGFGGSDFEIFLYNGSATTQITDNDFWDRYPQINDNGYVVWERLDGSDNEIFLYNGSTITQITNNDYHDFSPQINANGQLVWRGDVGSDSEIFLYNGSTTTQITDNDYDDTNPQINANGQVVWQGYDGSDYEIFLYSGSTTTQITDNDYDDTNPQINANGQVVWKEYGDVYPNSRLLGISLYDGSTTIRIKDYTYCNFPHEQLYPQINANGHVVWDTGVPNTEIFLYDGPTITQIVNRGYVNHFPQINDYGHVVWAGVDSSTSYDDGIFLYDGSTTTKIASGSLGGSGYPQININGQVVWQGWGDGVARIFLTKPDVSDVSIADILVFFDESVSNGTLQGDGPGASAEGRLAALRNMLLEAERLIDAGDNACGQLNAAYQLTDGNPTPSDFVSGENAGELAGMIQDLMEGLGC